jgi:hemoglobin-like flavoprotein
VSANAFPRAAAIEASLELLAERCADPTPLVYERLFAEYPNMRPHFWRDTNGAVKGEMLSRVFEAILDFIGERHYAHMMIQTEMVTHEGYDIPREIFGTFFRTVAKTAREILAAEWTPEFETAWSELLIELDHYIQGTPRSDVASPFHRARVAAFEAGAVPSYSK